MTYNSTQFCHADLRAARDALAYFMQAISEDIPTHVRRKSLRIGTVHAVQRAAQRALRGARSVFRVIARSACPSACSRLARVSVANTRLSRICGKSSQHRARFPTRLIFSLSIYIEAQRKTVPDDANLPKLHALNSRIDFWELRAFLFSSS